MTKINPVSPHGRLVATDLREDADLKPSEILKGWVLVTEASHPTLFECFETISHDCGSGAGHTNYSVPPEWAPHLQNLEEAIKPLSAEEVQTFCIGCETEVAVIAARSEILTTAGKMLTCFWADWGKWEDPSVHYL